MRNAGSCCLLPCFTAMGIPFCIATVLMLFIHDVAASQSTQTSMSCTVASYGAVPDNRTDNTAAFRAAAASCAEVVVPPGVWLTGPFNLSSHSVLRVEGTISGIQMPGAYPIVTLLPADESFRAPWKRNRQRQALVSAYAAVNVTVTGSGIIDGNGWPWWDNQTIQGCQGHHKPSWQPGANQTACLVQRPKLVEFVDCEDVVLQGASDSAPLTLRNSPFWTFHPIFCARVRVQHVRFLAPRDHGNTDGIDPDSCDSVHVSDCLVDVGDDAVSVKSGRHWKTGDRVPAQNYLFERVNILYRNFAIGSSVAGGVRNVTFRDSTIGDDSGSSPWALKIKTDSQEGGFVDGVLVKNVRIGNITYCGSSRFVFTPPHSAKDYCDPRQPTGASMFLLDMGYGLPPTDPGTISNIQFDGIYGIGPTGPSLEAHGLPSNATVNKNILNLTLHNMSLEVGGAYACDRVEGVDVDGVRRWPAGSTCK